MRVALTGGYGHLGSILGKTCTDLWRVVADLRHPEVLDREIEIAQPDVVINCAAIVGSLACDRAGAAAVRRINIEGAGFVARAAAKVGARFVHLSSCSIYDPLGVRPYFEEDNGKFARTLYGKSKWASEAAVHEMFGEDALIIRPSFVYGAGNDISLLSQLARASRGYNVVTLDMDMQKQKSYLYHDDFATAVWGLVEAECTGTYNVASDDYRPWAEFARILEERGLWPRYLIERPELDYKGDHLIGTEKLRAALPWWRECTNIVEGVQEL